MRDDDIDAHLKKAFQEMTREDLPDRFTELLTRLKSGSDGSDGSGRGNGE